MLTVLTGCHSLPQPLGKFAAALEDGDEQVIERARGGVILAGLQSIATDTRAATGRQCDAELEAYIDQALREAAALREAGRPWGWNSVREQMESKIAAEALGQCVHRRGPRRA
jgi:hypothetical protein